MRINRLIKNLILSDILIVSSFGLISPIFALFISEKISGGTIEVVGFSWTIYLISKSLVQLPVAGIVDKIKGEKDDFWFVMIGSIIFSLVPILYIFISSVSGLYLVQIVYGVFSGIVIPAWNAIYTRHVDKNHVGLEWSIWGVSIGLGSAIASAIGGIIAYRLGFDFLFIVVSVFSLIGTFFITLVYKDLHKINILDSIISKITK